MRKHAPPYIGLAPASSSQEEKDEGGRTIFNRFS